jgi:hypothetical protein
VPDPQVTGPTTVACGIFGAVQVDEPFFDIGFMIYLF